MLWNSSGSLVYLGCQWLITVLVVRLSSGYDAAGVLALAMAISNMFSPIADYKMGIYQVSDVKGENAVGEYLAFRLFTSGAALVAIVVYSGLTSPPSSLAAIYLYCLTKLLSLVIDVLHSRDQLERRMDYIGQSLMLQGVSTLASFSIVFGLTQDLSLACAAMAVSTVVVGLAFDLPRTLRFGPIHIRITRQKTLHLLFSCFPIVVAAIALAAAPTVPRQFLAAQNGEAALGIYASVAALAAIIQMGAGYIYSPLMTYFASAFAEGRTEELNRLFRRAIAGIFAVGVVAAIGLELVGPWLLRLMYGSSIDPYFYLMQPIIVFTTLTGFVWFFSSLLIALRDFKGNVVGNLVAIAIALPATFIFVPRWDMNGVSFTGIASYGIGGIVMAIYLIRLFRRGPKVDPVVAPNQDSEDK